MQRAPKFTLGNPGNPASPLVEPPLSKFCSRKLNSANTLKERLEIFKQYNF